MSNTTEKVTKTNRHYGEGSIYQRKDGRWVAKYRDEAMAKPQYLYGSTEAEFAASCGIGKSRRHAV
mgnify:FL=1